MNQRVRKNGFYYASLFIHNAAWVKLLVLKKFSLTGQADKSSKAFYLYLRARALNVMPDVDPVAEESLSKALKLNPALIEAWNELGECLWKKGKVRDAKNCFENALTHVSTLCL